MRRLCFISLLLFFIGCESSKNKDYQFGKINLEFPDQIIELPNFLYEISGLAILNDSTLLCLGDEHGKVYAVNLNNASVKLYADINKKADFEALAIYRDTLILLESDGDIYIPQENSSYFKIPFPFKKGLELESLCLSNSDSLYYAVKNAREKKQQKRIQVFSFDFISKRFTENPILSWKKPDELKNFKPSGLCQKENDIYMLSGVNQQLLRLNKLTLEYEYASLPINLLPQAEGIEMMNNSLYIATEKSILSPAQILVYHEK